MPPPTAFWFTATPTYPPVDKEWMSPPRVVPEEFEFEEAETEMEGRGFWIEDEEEDAPLVDMEAAPPTSMQPVLPGREG